MGNTTGDALTTAIQQRWSAEPGQKAQRYINQFFDCTRSGDEIVGKVKGNHGTYTVSIRFDSQTVTSACSCYIGKHGGCHHCAALAYTFLRKPDTFTIVEVAEMDPADIRTLADLETYLSQTTLDELTDQLRARGITQTALAGAMGMNPRHFTIVKSSERRNRYFNELGAIKVACMWALEHLAE